MIVPDLVGWVLIVIWAVWITLHLAAIPFANIIAADRAAKAQREAAMRNAAEAQRQFEASQP